MDLSLEKALWYPFWYELDPSIEIGCVNDFAFFRTPPAPLANETRPIFYCGFRNDKHLYYCAKKRILEIHHPQIGDIQNIDARGLDYTVTLKNGTILTVNAEESPGIIQNFHEPIVDWRVFVDMEPV